MKNFAEKHVMHELRRDLAEAHKAIEAKYGVTLSVETISADRDGSKFSVSVKGVVGTPEEAAKKDFIKLAARYGLAPEDLGREIVLSGKTYKIAGLEVRRGRAKVQVTRQPDGKSFTALPGQVSNALGRTPATSDAAPDNLQEILDLIGTMGKAQPGPDFVAGLRREDEILTSVMALAAKSSGPVGKVIKFHVADGYAFYLVTKVDSRYAYVMQIPFADCYQYSGVVGGKLDRLVAEQNIRQVAAMEAIFAKKQTAA